MLCGCCFSEHVSEETIHPRILLEVTKLFTMLKFVVSYMYVISINLQVVRARKKDTGVIYALKIMDKKFITKENKTAYVKLERIVLDQLDHPGVVRLYFTFQDSFSLCRYSWT